MFRLVNNFRGIRSFGETFADPRIDQVFSDLLQRIQPDLVHFNHLIKLRSTASDHCRAWHSKSVYSARLLGAVPDVSICTTGASRLAPGHGEAVTVTAA